MTTQLDERRIVAVEGAYNVRDLGGYATKDGRTTRWGVLFRADGLHRLSPQSQSALVDKGIRAVIDLRHARELEEKRNVFAESESVDYYHISLLNPANAGTGHVRSLGDLYIKLLEGSRDELLRVFQVLADGSGRATLFHCAAGKDRTGVVAALLLELAGVPHNVIAEDYSLTAVLIAPIMEELRGGRPEAVTDEQYERFLGSDPDHMIDMLLHLEARYGGAESYLRSIGLLEEQIRHLKEKLVSAESEG